MTPPPLPKPIRYRIFSGRSAGEIRFDINKAVSERLEDAHQQVETWLNENPSLEVISISNGFMGRERIEVMTITVWYREPSP
ncbi:MAG: hypothetical protein Q7Q71_00525 [Verrucomicrobiota bacterium JB023]|nr:hypothetical protein [Verrucomicrobiota bacterium JB023]